MPRNAILGVALIGAVFAVASCSSGDGGSGGVDAGGDTDSDTVPEDGGNECDEIDFPLSGSPPSILILLDRSGSMSLAGQWGIAKQALVQITAQMDYQIRFGLMLFPHEQGLCQPSLATPEVLLADQNAAEIEAALNDTTPLGPGTPTAMSLRNAYLYLLTEEDDSAKFVLLATDGAPNCSIDPTMSCDTCVSSDPTENCTDPFICLDDQMTYAQVIEYHDNWGINTYVIGMGGVIAEWDQVMTNIATYGGTEDYYPSNTPETIEQALQEIAAETTECIFVVDWESLEEGTSTDPTMVNLYANGEIIAFSEECTDENGWHWIDESTIELCPGLCYDYRWGYISEIGATFGCETYVE
jgi:hypothetical protein